MLLRDSLDEVVADVSVDLAALTTTSRQRGMAIRRRRRALATVGTAAAATVLAIGAWAALPGAAGPDGTIATDAAPPVVSGPLGGETAPASDAAMRVALTTAVHQVAAGGLSHVQGDAYGHESFAALVLDPPGAGAGQVMVNVQPLADSVGDPPYTCGDTSVTGMADCSVRRLRGGDVLRTYREDDDTEYGRGSQRQVAEVLSPDRGLRVVVNALNTTPWTGSSILRDTPVLTLEQEIEIATLPWWDTTTVPVEFVDAG